MLIPDFQGLEEPLRIVLEAKPNVLNHNTETVPRLYRAVRSGARYQRTLDLLANAKKWDPATVTKSGVMVGIGEETGGADRSFPRPRRARRGHSDDWPVSASVKRSSADDALLHAGRVCLR